MYVILVPISNICELCEKIADNGQGIAEGGASQHLTSTKIPYSKDKQNFLKKQLTPLAAIPCYQLYYFFLRGVFSA
ncbi:hypothetical protein AQB27_09675 [Riemerella anatipestifer]|nr:hypothetical protein AQB27_09675 [Riemerella anatipestifer]